MRGNETEIRQKRREYKKIKKKQEEKIEDEEEKEKCTEAMRKDVRMENEKRTKRMTE